MYSAIALELWVLSRAWYTAGYINNGPQGVRTSDQHELDLIINVLSSPYSRGWLVEGSADLLYSVSGFRPSVSAVDSDVLTTYWGTTLL